MEDLVYTEKRPGTLRYKDYVPMAHNSEVIIIRTEVMKPLGQTAHALRTMFLAL